MINPLLARVEELRREGKGLGEAVSIVRREALVKQIEEAKTMDDLRPILLAILDRISLR